MLFPRQTDEAQLFPVQSLMLIQVSQMLLGLPISTFISTGKSQKP